MRRAEIIKDRLAGTAKYLYGAAGNRFNVEYLQTQENYGVKFCFAEHNEASALLPA